MPFNFDNVETSHDLDIDLLANGIKALNDIITKRNTVENKSFELLESQKTKIGIGIVQNSTWDDILTNFESWFIYFYEYDNLEKLLCIFPFNPVIISSETGQCMQKCRSANYHLHISPEQHSYTLLAGFQWFKSYELKHIKNKIAKYIFHKDIEGIDIPMAEFDFKLLYSFLLINSLLQATNCNSEKSMSLNHYIINESEYISNYVILKNNVEDYVDFIYQIGTESANSIIGKLFSHVSIKELLSIITYNLILHNKITNREKLEHIMQTENSLYGICYHIVKNNLITRN